MCLALGGTIGMTVLILACALSTYKYRTDTFVGNAQPSVHFSITTSTFGSISQLVAVLRRDVLRLVPVATLHRSRLERDFGRAPRCVHVLCDRNDPVQFCAAHRAGAIVGGERLDLHTHPPTQSCWLFCRL